MTLELAIAGGRTLQQDGSLRECSLLTKGARIVRIDATPTAATRAADIVLDATGLHVLPGIVDIHGDAFERQLLPRPGVQVPAEVALIDTDRQLLAAGITTAFHSVTWSWEPGLRGRESFVTVLDALQTLAPRLGCDTRMHLRIETFNLDAEDDVLDWMQAGRIHMIAYNDHTPHMMQHIKENKRDKLRRYADRTGLDEAAFVALARRVGERAAEVDDYVARLAAVARACGIAQLSHDDDSPAQRARFDALGCAVAEFPMNLETTRAARARGNVIVFGAPNVMRGGSHNASLAAADMVQDGLCDVLASDYYYPAPLQAAFRLSREGRCSFAAAWQLVSTNPARAAGLGDRGVLREGARADLVLVDASGECPRVCATIAGGRLHLFDQRVLARRAASAALS